MATITFDGDDSWTSPRWAFARLARATTLFLTDEGDLETLDQAVARDRLDFPRLDPERAARLARALRQGAGWLREEIGNSRRRSAEDKQLAESLAPLSTFLTWVATGQVGPFWPSQGLLPIPTTLDRRRPTAPEHPTVPQSPGDRRLTATIR